MRKIVRIKDLPEHAGETVTVQGWLYNRRSSKKLQFLQVRDGTGVVQAIVSRSDAGDELFDRAGAPGQESSLRVTGEAHADERAPGGVELRVSDLEVVGEARDYPLGKQAHGPDFLLSQRHLWLRSRKQAAILRIRDTVIRAIRDFFHARGFVNVDAPVFTPAACEGTTTLFELDYTDDQKAYLTQSGQLYMEAAVMALGRVYCFGPCFRAEKSKTRKHLREFWMIEPEIAFAGLEEAIELCESNLKAIVERVLEDNRGDLEVLERDAAALEKSLQPFARMSYDEAAKILQEKTGFKPGDDFGAPDEEALVEGLETPLVVHHWPHAVKAFYMRRDPQNPELALGFDILAPEGQIEAHQLPPEAFEWYLDLRRYGSVPHSGYGLGLERTVAWVCGTKHIRETIPFPRTLYRIYP
jgi:asparaginyl-tRNA synthetase